jgi:hypothetical protein
MPAVRLGERECGIVAANATTDAGESLTRCIIARTPTEAVCVTELDQWRILERRTKWRLVRICSFSWNRVSHASVALEDDVSGTAFRLSSATTKEESQTARLVLS